MSNGATGARLGDFTADHRMLVLSLMGGITGAIGALAAYGLLWLIAVITNLFYFQRFSSELPALANIAFSPWMVLLPIAGGLIVGLLAKFGSEKIRGGGIPEALEAILNFRSKIDPKVAVLKPVSSAVAIGSGGPFGAEGPIIMTGGAFGSLFAQFFRLTSAERKTLLVAGATGGMTAIFGTPVAAVVLALELLLFEWRPRSLVPVVVACVVAAIVRSQILDAGPLFPATSHGLPTSMMYLYAVGGGVAVGIAATMVTEMLYLSEALFRRIPVHWMWWPAIGGVAVGIGGLIEPAALGIGYESIEDLLAGNAVAGTLVVLLLVKAVIWSLALGSGTAGGVFAPLLLMGGALGALLSFVFPEGDVTIWVMVGMAAMIAGAMRAPITATVFMLELTHDLNPFLVVLVGAISAYGVTVLIMRRDVLTHKLADHGGHVAREYGVDALQVTSAGEIMDRHPMTIGPEMTVHELSDLMMHEPKMEHRQGFPIVDDAGHLVGIITRSDVMRVLHLEGHGDDKVIDVGNSNPVVCYPSEPLADVASRMLQHDIGRLPVVDPSDNVTLVGYIGRSGLLAARSQLAEEESVRERVISWKRMTWRRRAVYLWHRYLRSRHLHRTHNRMHD